MGPSRVSRVCRPYASSPKGFSMTPPDSNPTPSYPTSCSALRAASAQVYRAGWRLAARD